MAGGPRIRAAYFFFLVLNSHYILYYEGIVGGIHGGHYRLYLLCAGGRLVVMDERLYGKK
jgi:hypothetical protein